MSELFVARVEEFSSGERRLVVIDGREVVVLRVDDEFHAYENRCLHMGGPVGEGAVMARVEPVLDSANCLTGERFSDTDLQLVCPWHGWAYDVRNGICAGDRRRRLRQFPTNVRDGEVYVGA